MIDTLSLVKDFHEKFGHPVHDEPYIGDILLNKRRTDLIDEELCELILALKEGNKKEVLDALLDLQYVVDGAFLDLGFWKVKYRSFQEVHFSNMSKLGADGKPILRGDGKILKGPNYFPPRLDMFI